MKKLLALLLALSLALTSCISVASETEVPTPIVFVTSTLPPTHTLVTRATLTPTGLVEKPTLAVTAPANCKVVAVLIDDVTIPDGTKVAAGSSFTKTWKFKNTGTCPWQGYSLNFSNGDRMGAPDSAPVQGTAAGEFVNISVNLVAPSRDGSYTGFFELQDQSGEVVPIGLENTFWVKIVVGAGGVDPGVESTASSGSANSGDEPVTSGNCQASTNAAYVAEILSLINAERAAASVPAVSSNGQLQAAAQAHSLDMACSNSISHTGSDGSTIGGRIAASGYSPSYYIEIIAIGGPQDAIAQWSDDALHRNAMLDRNVTEIGVGYAFSEGGYGGYITVDMASP